ncbi:hypothetical protein P170DRAFT_447377 [Aspergillus steynii IBT 23096]|uniref:RTA1 domain protein n=1 Tax=Aspergillus steynii IBT 23096 TaxID=1392250 RepID=A0A2I2GA83_9EURO|nr:uncharacterized protein P170DRAFT_447377 [Aspergillus steynii IBT 23096]PLB49787.1 hypothetical protein P170DRAFT_447377 [Aspergillus steynii IBT 23096]
MHGIAYFELSWSILSSIGLFTALLAIWAVLITRPSPLSYVPIVVSVACAAANGLCYFSYYTSHSLVHRIAGSAFADIFWLIQEAGLSFYSYQILTHTLHNSARTSFLLIFWSLMLLILGLRLAILVSRILDLQTPSNTKPSTLNQHRISYLHVGYFVSIALVESWSSFFLIRLLNSARDLSPKVSSTREVFRYLLRTTEIRVASLAAVGVTRAITYSWQVTAQSAVSVQGEVDRFVYCGECLFPLVLIVDILASKKYSPVAASEPRSPLQRAGHVRVPTSDSWPLRREWESP